MYNFKRIRKLVEYVVDGEPEIDKVLETLATEIADRDERFLVLNLIGYRVNDQYPPFSAYQHLFCCLYDLEKWMAESVLGQINCGCCVNERYLVFDLEEYTVLNTQLKFDFDAYRTEFGPITA